jgi:hypothetical protein
MSLADGTCNRCVSEECGRDAVIVFMQSRERTERLVGSAIL